MELCHQASQQSTRCALIWRIDIFINLRILRDLSAKQGRSQEANGFNSRTLRHAEGTAEWPATGPENQGIVMSDGRSIRLPSAKVCTGA